MSKLENEVARLSGLLLSACKLLQMYGMDDSNYMARDLLRWWQAHDTLRLIRKARALADADEQ